MRRMRPRRPILPSELDSMKAMHAAGISISKIATHFDRKRPTVDRILNDRQRAPVARTECGQGFRSDLAVDSMRPAHVKARPFTRAWYEQCDRAFVRAHRQAHPDIAGVAANQRCPSPSRALRGAMP